MNNTYLWLKLLHIVGVILFMGNIIVTGWWKFMADRTRDPKIIAFAQRQVTLTDYVFTAGGIVLILVSGILNAVLHDMDYLGINWMAWGLGLFTITGMIWVAVLVPIQIKQERMAKQFSSQTTIPGGYWALCKLWNFFGTIAILLPMLAVYFMVFKPV